MIRNSPAHWGLVSRTLHWTIALMILVQVPLGFWMNDVYRELIATSSRDFSQLLAISRVHHTNGFLILVLATLRLGWRATNAVPELPSGLAAYQRGLARLTHGFLYGLLLAFPLSGWATLSAYEGQFPIFFFGWDSVPRLVAQASDNSGYAFYASIHKACWRIGAAVLALHVVAALWHQWVKKDELLARMWRG